MYMYRHVCRSNTLPTHSHAHPHPTPHPLLPPSHTPLSASHPYLTLDTPLHPPPHLETTTVLIPSTTAFDTTFTDGSRIFPAS